MALASKTGGRLRRCQANSDLKSELQLLAAAIAASGKQRAKYKTCKAHHLFLNLNTSYVILLYS
jgi:hypothetical protein